MKNLFYAILISAFATLLILLIHTDLLCKTMIALQHNDAANEIFESSYLTEAVAYHKELVDFAKRPVSTFLIEQFAHISRVSIGDSFVLINFLFLFLNGILLFILSCRHFTTPAKALFNLLIYYSSYAVLFSFFIPVYSYDEPVQYFFIFLLLIFYFGQKYFLFVIAAFFALLSRETSVLILGGLFFYHVKLHSFKAKAALQFLIPLFLYGAYLTCFFLAHQQQSIDFQTASTSRLNAIHINFADAAFSSEAIFAFINTSLLSICFIYSALKRGRLITRDVIWFDAYLIVLFINIIVTYFLTLAREVRLFNLPMILFYPFSFIILDEIKHIIRVSDFRVLLRKWQFWIVCATSLFFVYILSFKLFTVTIGLDIDNLFNEYTFLMLSIVALYTIIRCFNAADVRSLPSYSEGSSMKDQY